VALYALQRGPERAQIFLPGAPTVENPDDDSDDVLDTASLIRRLDLVVSVDTMVAHLAGALGAPVWTLLHDAADWRWMRDRADSPWYPTMRLFRQRTPGDWASVVHDVVRELRTRAEAPSPACGRGSG
jgi:ADP-heptose:LPS heptosyltransferase